MSDLLFYSFPASGVETWLFLPPLVAFGISFFTSMGGISGAFLILPFQIGVLGFTTPAVSATNFLFNVVATPGGIYRYRREGRMPWSFAWLLSAGIVPGVLVGYYLRVIYLPDPELFRLFAGLVLLYIGVRLLLDARSATSNGNHVGSLESFTLGPGRCHYRYAGEPRSFSTPMLIFITLTMGVLGGTYGIGGGALVAPFCVAILRMPVHAIAGAVLFSTLFSSAAGVFFYTLIPVGGGTNPPDWLLGLLFGIGGLAGTYLGARGQRYVSEHWIKLLLGLIVVGLGGKYAGGYLF